MALCPPVAPYRNWLLLPCTCASNAGSWQEMHQARVSKCCNLHEAFGFATCCSGPTDPTVGRATWHGSQFPQPAACAAAVFTSRPGSTKEPQPVKACAPGPSGPSGPAGPGSPTRRPCLRHPIFWLFLGGPTAVHAVAKFSKFSNLFSQ